MSHRINWRRVLSGNVPTRVLSGSLHGALLARGIDYAMTSPAAFKTVTDWASPQAIGWAFIVISVVGLIGVLSGHPALTTVSHGAAASMFLVMGLFGIGPVLAATAGWTWRMPITYILGNGVVHLFAANASYDRWLKLRGRRRFVDRRTSNALASPGLVGADYVRELLRSSFPFPDVRTDREDPRRFG